MESRTERRIAHHISRFIDPDPKAGGRAEAFLIRHYAGKATSALLVCCADPSPTIRMRAVYTLGRSGDHSAFETLLALTEDSDESVRYDAVLSLGKLGDQRAIEPLLAMALTGDESRPAWNGLASFGTAIIPLAADLSKSDDAKVRDSAIWLAAQVIYSGIRDEKCADLILSARLDTDETVQGNAEFWIEEFRLESA